MLSRLRERQEWKFFAVLPHAHRRLAFAWWTLLVLSGALPAVFAIVMGYTVAAVQQAAPLTVPLIMVAVVFVTQQVVGPFRVAVCENLGDLVSARLVQRLPEGLHSQLGPTRPDGHQLSFGQWQKLALSRVYMREEPLLMVLDEPTAALDAETEHQLFSSYAEGARRTSVGGVTILVSHRFSTVRMADQIVVLDGSRLVEAGSHDDLMRRGGLYAELYRIQASAYR